MCQKTSSNPENEKPIVARSEDRSNSYEEKMRRYDKG